MPKSFQRNRPRIFNYKSAYLCYDRIALNYGDPGPCVYPPSSGIEVSLGGPSLYPVPANGCFYAPFYQYDGGKFVVQNPTGLTAMIFYYGPSAETLCNDQVRSANINPGNTATVFVRKNASNDRAYLYIYTITSVNLTLSNWTDSC